MGVKKEGLSDPHLSSEPTLSPILHSILPLHSHCPVQAALLHIGAARGALLSPLLAAQCFHTIIPSFVRG